MENLNESLLGIKIPVVCSTWIILYIIILQFHNFPYFDNRVSWSCNPALSKEKISWVTAEFTVISYFDVPPTSCLHTIGLAVLNRNDVLTCIICDKKTVAVLDSLICAELKSQWPYCQEYWLDQDLGVEVFFYGNCEAQLTQCFQLYLLSHTIRKAISKIVHCHRLNLNQGFLLVAPPARPQTLIG